MSESPRGLHRHACSQSLMEDHLSIVLLGKAGAGKSSSGNTILGRAVFESKLSFRPVTTLISVASGSVFGKQVSVTDTPDILGSERQVQTFCQCVLQDSSPVLFLLVIRVGRFTEEDHRAVDAASRVIGSHRLEKCYLLFTGGDELMMSVDNYILKDKKSSLPGVVERFSWRIHLFNNKDGGQEQVKELLENTGNFSADVKSPLPITHYSETLQSNHQFRFVSLKDIISNSDQKSDGPPAVYQLRPKKERIGTLTRMTVGEKNPHKPNKTILLVGETGAGKSTLINALLNYTMGMKWEDEVWFQIVEDEKRSQAESQTSDVIVYKIFGFEDKTLPYSLTIIDTPGYGDTRGTECDDIISERLLDLFGSDDGVHELHAVGLVMKASDNRLSERLRYVFDSVMSLFGKNMEKNIIALITHSDGSRPKNPLKALEDAKIKCARNEKNQPVYFLFNNQQHEDRTENKLSKYLWELTQENMSKLKDFLGKSNPQKLMKTVEVLNERIRLTASIHNLQDRIKLAEVKQREIRQIQQALKEHEENMKRNEKFTVEIDEVYTDKERIYGRMWGLFFYSGAVCCTVCKENCHYPGCTMAWTPAYCEVMKGGRCTVCTNKCPASDHVKGTWRYVTKTRRVMKTVSDLKEKYEKNKTESEKKSNLLENLEKEMNRLTAEKSQFLDESYQHVVRLEQIALKADSASTIVYLDFLIEKMMEKGDTEKVQKLVEMRWRVDEGTRKALRYKQHEQSV